MSDLLMAIRRAHACKDLNPLIELVRLKSEKRSFDKRMGEMVRANAKLNDENEKLKHELNKRVVLDDDGNIQYRRPSMTELKREVAKKYGFSTGDLESKRRTGPLALARHIVFYLAKKHTTFSQPHIGRKLGGRDHTTVLYGAEKIAHLIKTETDLANEIKEIESSLQITENGIPLTEEVA